MAGNIQCTFEGCYQRFASVEAMKKHKAKMSEKGDDIHDFYCKKCDEDCSDDVEYLIHQISSPKHIVCPACGLEFKSEGGRDRHVGITHRQKQSLKCQGCKELFTDAAGLIGHIETNKCKVIKRDDFHRHRAEQQIEKDAIDELNGGMYHGSTILPSEIDPDPSGGTSLADNERVHLSNPWHDSVQRDIDPFDGRQTSVSQATSAFAVDKYPPLVAAAPPSTFNLPYRTRYETEVDMEDPADSNEPQTTSSQGPQPQPTQSVPTNGGVWSNNAISLAIRGPRSDTSPNLLDSASSVNLLDSSVADDSSVATRGTRPSALEGRSDYIPPAVKAENQDPNAPYAQVQTAQRARLPARQNLENYWNAVLSCYICPGSKCGRRLRSRQDFEEHLLSGAHVVETVQCPSCLKRFKTTTALVAHAESGSTKCDLRKTEEFDLAMRSITAGLIKVDGSWSGTGNPRFESVPVKDWNNDSRW